MSKINDKWKVGRTVNSKKVADGLLTDAGKIRMPGLPPTSAGTVRWSPDHLPALQSCAAG
jgi:hypothetical protein